MQRGQIDMLCKLSEVSISRGFLMFGSLLRSVEAVGEPTLVIIRILKKHKLGVTLHKKVPGFSTALGELKAWCAVCIVSVFSAQFVITHILV